MYSVHVGVCVCVCSVFMCECMCACVCTCMCVCVMCVCVCMCAYVHVCVHVCFVSACVCVYVYVCACVCTHEVDTSVHLCLRTCVCMCERVCVVDHTLACGCTSVMCVQSALLTVLGVGVARAAPQTSRTLCMNKCTQTNYISCSTNLCSIEASTCARATHTSFVLGLIPVPIHFQYGLWH